MYGINPRLQRSFDRAQAQHEAQQPPGWDTPDYADDCAAGDCGECRPCIDSAAEYAAELAAEAAYDAQEDRRLGL